MTRKIFDSFISKSKEYKKIVLNFSEPKIKTKKLILINSLSGQTQKFITKLQKFPQKITLKIPIQNKNTTQT